jgi:hypothetical protein
VDEARLAADLGEFAFDHADMQLKDLKIGVLLHRVSPILSEHSIVPPDLTLLFKALITLEGTRAQYDPARLGTRMQSTILWRHPSGRSHCNGTHCPTTGSEKAHPIAGGSRQKTGMPFA